MTRFMIAAAALVLAVAFTAAACSDDGPTDPSGVPNPTFRAPLASANEVPPIANAEAGANGTMNITLNLTRDAGGAITAATATFNGTLAGFPAGTVITAAHIHPGVAGVNGGVAVNLALAPGEIVLTNGTGTIVKNNVTMTVDQANQIIGNPSAFYFNAHTALNPGGAVRGQLVRTN